MTIHHIHPKATLHAYQQIINLNLYTQKYSINLLQITMTDILVRNIKNRFFDFSSSNNLIYTFLDQFALIRLNAKDLLSTKQSTPNDLLPFNKINIERYILSAL